MKPILYEKDETVFASNGLGRLRDCLSCIVTEERNGIYECEFSVPVGGANFDLIQCGRIIGVTHDEMGDVQPFDIVSMSRPISGVVTFHAVHISYRQRGLVTRGSNVNSLADALTTIKGASVPANPFTYSADFASTGYCAALADMLPHSVRSVLGGIEGSILDTYGGEYKFDRFTVQLMRQRGQVRPLTIRYGVNMLDYSDDTDYSNTYASAVPYWKGNEDGSDVLVVGSKVTGTTVTYNGRDDCAALDLTDKFENKPTTAQLEAAALSYMHSQQSAMPAQTIRLDFVRLQDMGYDWLDSLLRCELCDTITVEFPRYGMRGAFKIVKTEWDVLAGRYTGMELGQLSTTLADALGISQSTDSLNKITDLSIAGDMSVGGSLFIGGEQLLDMVSEEGGTGTQDNWHYIKLANGIAACWRRWNQSGVNINQSAGQLRYASLGTVSDYPITFHYNPVVLFSGSVTNGNGWVSNNRTNQTTTNCGGFFAYSYANQSSAVVTVNIIAIGRWKAS